MVKYLYSQHKVKKSFKNATNNEIKQMIKTKKLIPFTNEIDSDDDAESWYDRNCERCTTQCYYEENMALLSLGLSKTKAITLKTAQFIGHKSNDGKFVQLNRTCQHKDNYQKKVTVKKVDFSDNFRLQ